MKQAKLDKQNYHKRHHQFIKCTFFFLQKLISNLKKKTTKHIFFRA